MTRLKRGQQKKRVCEDRAPAGFAEVDHTADRAISVWARSPGELFEQAAWGLFSLLGDLTHELPLSRHEISFVYDDLESALVDWLNELLYWHETQREIYSEFTVSFEGGILRGRFTGRPADAPQVVVKAATFHDLTVRQDHAGEWRATIVFDT